MAKKQEKEVKKVKVEKSCETCIFNGDKCQHESNKGIIVKYRLETEVFFQTPEEINKNGKCKNYVELSKK